MIQLLGYLKVDFYNILTIDHGKGDEETFNHAIESRTTTEREIVPISTDIAA